MQLRFFTIPVHGGAEQEDALNRFLAGHRILSIDRFMVQDGSNSAWSLCVGFEPSAAETRPSLAGKRVVAKLDYREVLNDADFAVFARLRALRKELSEADGVPAYALFTNEQLAEMVQRRVRTAAALLEIPGVGASRVEKHGERFLDLLRQGDGTS